MAAILLVEDDRAVREAVSMALLQFGYRVDTAASGDQALSRWRARRHDLVLLDIMLPHGDGLEVCRTIRTEDRVPVIMLTARNDPIDVVMGLESGADDYVTKPFEMGVLLARVRAVLRRTRAEAGRGPERYGDLEIDRVGWTVSKVGQTLPLTATELKLLLELSSRPGQVYTRRLLLERVWEYTHLGDSRLVDVCVQRLRSKIEDDPAHPVLIETVRGMGYKFVRP